MYSPADVDEDGIGAHLAKSFFIEESLGLGWEGTAYHYKPRLTQQRVKGNYQRQKTNTYEWVTHTKTDFSIPVQPSTMICWFVKTPLLQWLQVPTLKSLHIQLVHKIIIPFLEPQLKVNFLTRFAKFKVLRDKEWAYALSLNLKHFWRKGIYKKRCLPLPLIYYHINYVMMF